MKIGELFAGIGGLGLGAAYITGGRVAWQVEHDPAAAAVLRRRFPGSRVICGDVRDVAGAELEPVDLICGGFPCQDLSVAGKQAGLDGERSGLYCELVRIVDEAKPGAVLIENVPPLLRYRDRVDADLAAIGYRTEWARMSALGAGAPHLRRRVFVLACRGEQPSAVRAVASMPWGGDMPWPTPLSSDSKGPGPRPGLNKGATLTDAIKGLWPTPTATQRDNQGGSGGRVGPVRPCLESAVSETWPTPCARDYRTGADGAFAERRDANGSGPSLSDALTGRLNPAWVETVMGLPVGWTDPDADVDEVAALDLIGSPRWPAGWDRSIEGGGPQHEWEPPRTVTGAPVRGRPARLRQLGNAVVPAQGAAALQQLLRGCTCGGLSLFPDMKMPLCDNCWR